VRHFAKNFAIFAVSSAFVYRKVRKVFRKGRKGKRPPVKNYPAMSIFYRQRENVVLSFCNRLRSQKQIYLKVGDSFFGDLVKRFTDRRVGF
jgi:hypothetical protein